MAELTIEQKRAVALANARLRAKQNNTLTPSEVQASGVEIGTEVPIEAANEISAESALSGRRGYTPDAGYSANAQAFGYSGDPAGDVATQQANKQKLQDAKGKALEASPDDAMTLKEHLSSVWKRGMISGSQARTSSGLRVLMPELEEKRKDLLEMEADIKRREAAGQDDGFLRFMRKKAEADRGLIQSMEQSVTKETGRIVSSELKKASIEVSKGMKELAAAEGFFEKLKAVGSNPVQTITGLIAESTAQQAPELIQMTLGGLAGGPLVGGGLTFQNTLVSEQANAMIEELRNAGVDFTSPESVEAALNNPELLRNASNAGFRKAIPVAMFSAASMGKVPVTGKLKSIAAEVGVQVGADAAGETIGQILQSGEVDAGEVFEEIIAGFSQNLAETGVKVSGDGIAKFIPSTEKLPDGFEKTPTGEFLSEDGYSEQAFKALSENVAKEEFTKAFESQTLKDLAAAAYDGSTEAQDAMRLFSEQIKLEESRRREKFAEEAKRAREEEIKTEEEVFKVSAEEVEAFKEVEKIDPTEMMSPEELADFEAERDALSIEEEAALEAEQTQLSESEQSDIQQELQDLQSAMEDQGPLEEQLSASDEKAVSDLLGHLSGENELSPVALAKVRERVAGSKRMAKALSAAARKSERMAGKLNKRIESLQQRLQSLKDSSAEKLTQSKEKAREQRIADRRKVESQKADIRIKAAKRLETEVNKRVAAVKKAFQERHNITEAIKALENMVQKLPLKVRGKFRGFGKLSEKKGPEAQQRHLDKAIDRISSIFDDYFHREMQGQIRKVMKRFKAATASDIKSVDVRVTPEVRQSIELADKVANMPKNEALAMADDLRQEDGSFANEQDLLDYYVATTFAGVLTDSATVEEMGAARSALAFIAETGKLKAKERIEQRKQEVEQMELETVRAMLGSKGLQSDRVISKKREGAIFKAYDAVKTFALTRMEGFETMIDSLSSEKGRFEGYLHETFFARAFKASQEEHATVRKDLDEFATVIAKAIGLGDKPTGKEVRKVKRMLDSWSNVEENSGIVYKEQGVKQEQPLSVWEAMTIWMQWQDNTLSPTFEKMGIDEGTIDQVEAFIGPEGVKAAKSMMKWYAENGKRMADRVEEVDGYRPALVDNYSPITRRKTEKDEFSNLATGAQFARATEKNGSMKARIETTNELNFKPANTVFVEHVNNMNHYLAWAQIAKDLKTVFDSDTVKRAVRQASSSDKAYGVLKQMIDDMIRGSIDRNNVNRTMDAIIRNIAVSKLAFNATSAVKQLASVPAYMDTMPTKEFVKGIASFWKNPVKNAQTLIKTQYIQNRIRRSYDRDLAQVANKSTNLAITDIRNLKDKMMFLTRYGDLGAILQGGWAVYQHTYNQNKGKGHVEATQAAEKAFAEATDRAQQSAEVMSQSTWQRSGSFAKLFTMFMTSPIQYHRLTWGAVRAAKRGRISKAEAAKTVFVYHVLLPQIFTAMGSAFIGLWSDDDEVEEAFWKRQLAALAVGNLNSIYMFGEAIEAIAAGVTDEDMPSYMEETSIPVIDEINSAVKGAIGVAQAEDDEEFWKGADKLASGILSLSGVPYDPISKQLEGMVDTAQGETDNPLLRFLGFSEYAIFEDND